MIGQYSNDEFIAMYQKAGPLKRGHDLVNKTAWVQSGSATFNYYRQHEDGSWTNYDCKTKYTNS